MILKCLAASSMVLAASASDSVLLEQQPFTAMHKDGQQKFDELMSEIPLQHKQAFVEKINQVKTLAHEKAINSIENTFDVSYVFNYCFHDSKYYFNLE
ncbi:hypothetical protein [Candidatus Odyssella thessalonicensis]|uniref:hypothetical protein n=1 Tax=Candidatus Odyssella thessalonicensis TaxID=84647 RepID=UPI000225BDC4|nr:hypothetical protein [Candidatus Odyssella thessalonicensis]